MRPNSTNFAISVHVWGTPIAHIAATVGITWRFVYKAAEPPETRRTPGPFQPPCPSSHALSACLRGLFGIEIALPLSVARTARDMGSRHADLSKWQVPHTAAAGRPLVY